MADFDVNLQAALQEGQVIPASPLALTRERRLDERRQRALVRYYAAAGAGGLAVGVHTTQFAIRDPKIGLFKPLLELVGEELDRIEAQQGWRGVRIAGICGETDQAVGEASLGRRLGYQAGLVSLAAMRSASLDELLAHCRAVAEVIPVIGFYLQPAVGGCRLSYDFWRRFAEIENVVAIKIAPFNRYQTLDVIRAVTASGRDDIALYTGNDDHIVLDLLTPYRFECDGKPRERRMTGGLLGQWAVWTRRAVELLEECRRCVWEQSGVPDRLLQQSVDWTDANAAIFDAANGFQGCIAGVHEVLRRQGLLEGIWCLDPRETLGPGQAAEIERVYRVYPHLNDDAFVQEHLSEWLKE